MSPTHFTVIWRRSLIERTLADIVVRAMGRREDVTAITSAMDAIDRLLSEDPATRGESRDNFERILIVSPLSVTFEVHEEERVVHIMRLRYSPKGDHGD
jgi:hypothetical protein